MLCSFANFISTSRVKFMSRIGAIIFKLGLSARIVTSNLIWSFPLPVQPCEIAVAPSLFATSTAFAAISGRARAVASGYLPWYRPLALTLGTT